MALNAAQRLEVRNKAMQLLNGPSAPVTLTKPEIAAALNAIDDWIEANAVSMNTAIPQPARAAWDAATKAGLFAIVANARYGS